jgi:hypothetical protein
MKRLQQKSHTILKRTLFLGGEYYCFIMHRIVKGYDIHEKGKHLLLIERRSQGLRIPMEGIFPMKKLWGLLANIC